MDADKLREDWLREEQIAHMKGWDFSHIEGRHEIAPPPWDYKAVVGEYVQNDHWILDMDTGGGEVLLSLGHPHGRTAATEGYPPNVALCREKLLPLGIDFREMDDPARMPFEDGRFDRVLNRHGSFDPDEVHRVLKEGGLFITQQVGDENDWELVKALLPEKEKGEAVHNPEYRARQFRAAGFEILRQEDYFGPIRFYDTGALVWFARVLPWEFGGFSVEGCFDRLLEVQERIEREGFVEGREHRYLLVARKRGSLRAGQ